MKVAVGSYEHYDEICCILVNDLISGYMRPTRRLTNSTKIKYVS